MKTAAARKLESELQLASLGVRLNRHLPNIEDETEAQPPASGTVARRALVLYCITAIGFDAKPEEVRATLEAADLWSEVSAQERDLFREGGLSPEATVNAGWRAEATWVLLWALGLVPALALPTKQCSTAQLQSLLESHLDASHEFAEGARLRSVAELLDAADYIYRLHWATRQVRLDETGGPPGIDPGIVQERHYALNWLIGTEAGWDDITTDT